MTGFTLPSGDAVPVGDAAPVDPAEAIGTSGRGRTLTLAGCAGETMAARS
ncbi:hypothetical protein [Teichococcus vastitatis]|uniref:Uncharacterized protein n=1 Tax=Teichococcus vastitatis TaxID=2307076 RepID=A0ABS9WA86_9PROT|nr:hypothetical protein [Pseudoroseomonas vastitatis]MCI0755903.1 hypothetical protein [Pseudoroseomonas vastitatis]